MERVLASMQHKPVDRVPVYPILSGITRKLVNADYPTWSNDADVCAAALLKSAEDFDIDCIEGTVPREDGELCIASYMNFLIVNGGVIVPQYEDENDALALEQVQAMFPDRKVVGVNTREVVYGGGNIHCITQQMPKR
jgi:agmatine/peptidylarginine deiminase